MPWKWAPELGKRGKEARLYPMDLFDRHIDRVVVGSTWQAEQLTRRARIAPAKLAAIHLGVPLEHYRDLGPNRHPHRLIYTSQANRGLDDMLQLFPRIRSQVPDAQLYVFGNEYSEAGVPPERPGATEPGVVWAGAASKSVLARELRSSSVMAYPASFRETFCIAVAEAQAAGLPIVTTHLAALAERVDNGVDGFLVPGSARDSEYQDMFVNHVVRLLLDDVLWTGMSAAAESKARRLYDWETIGAQWESMLQGLVATSAPSVPQLDPDLDLLDTALLQVRAPQAVATVPPDLALQWLRARWTSYGFSAESLPGVSAHT
jgi:glycosyltransferase involved in cell wall biosynthesis